MIFATIDDFEEIMPIIRQYKKWFADIRNDYVKRMVLSGNCIYEDGVLIIFRKYKRKTRMGNCMCLKGDYKIHQIANKDQGNGNATKVLKKFFNFANGTIWLNTLEENEKAIDFYNKMGFKKVGNISWKKGKEKGYVFKKENKGLIDDFFKGT